MRCASAEWRYRNEGNVPGAASTGIGPLVQACRCARAWFSTMYSRSRRKSALRISSGDGSFVTPGAKKGAHCRSRGSPQNRG